MEIKLASSNENSSERGCTVVGLSSLVANQVLMWELCQNLGLNTLPRTAQQYWGRTLVMMMTTMLITAANWIYVVAAIFYSIII